MLYRFSIVFLIGLCLVACSSGSMQEESVPVIRFKPDEEGVQKGKIPPCRIGYLISVSNRDTNKSRVPNTFWTPSFCFRPASPPAHPPLMPVYHVGVGCSLSVAKVVRAFMGEKSGWKSV